MYFQFLPWCQIDREYRVGDITFLPFTFHAENDYLGKKEFKRIQKVLKSYRSNDDGKRVNEAVILRFKDSPILSDLSKEALEISYEMNQIACFSALSSRDFFKYGGNYCCSDNFRLEVNSFEDINSNYTALQTRRREGTHYDGRLMTRIYLTNPESVKLNRIKLDEKLIRSLVEFRSSENLDEWTHLKNSILCYNQANTDNPSISYQVEWILLCSAIEEIIQHGYKAKEVSWEFHDLLIPGKNVNLCFSRRKKEILGIFQHDSRSSVRHIWIKEFIKARGSYAHGTLDVRHRLVWKPLEHLILASIAFPLIAKIMLLKKGLYELSEYDLKQISCFEEFADGDFLSDLKLWSNLLNFEGLEILRIKMEKLFREGLSKKKR